MSSFLSGGNCRETEALSNKAREGSSEKWFLGGVHKNTGTDLEMSERSQQEPAVSTGPEGSLVWCVWGGGKVSPSFAVLHDPWEVLRGTPNKRDCRSKEM